MNLLLRTPALRTTVHCQIAACAVLHATPEAIAQWRRQPVGHGAKKTSASFLKHAEDQTVVALTAVFSAVAEQGWQDRSFTGWGVLAAPSFFGRISTAQAFARYRTEGAWGVSPHLIPQQSLHGMAGAISQALELHGPNFGIGGGPNPGQDAFLIALAMLADGAMPGLWLVLTGYETEWVPAPDRAVPAPPCHGVALALTPGNGTGGGWHLAIGQTAPDESPLPIHADFDLASFAADLANASSGTWRLSDSHWLELAAEARP